MIFVSITSTGFNIWLNYSSIINLTTFPSCAYFLKYLIWDKNYLFLKSLLGCASKTILVAPVFRGEEKDRFLFTVFNSLAINDLFLFVSIFPKTVSLIHVFNYYIIFTIVLYYLWVFVFSPQLFPLLCCIFCDGSFILKSNTSCLSYLPILSNNYLKLYLCAIIYFPLVISCISLLFYSFFFLWAYSVPFFLTFWFEYFFHLFSIFFFQ